MIDKKIYNLRATNFIYNYIVLRSVAPPSPFLLNDIKLIKNGKIFESIESFSYLRTKSHQNEAFMINKQELIKSKLIFDILYIIHETVSFLVLWADDIDQEGNSARVRRSL